MRKIKKYANRKMYDTIAKRYVSLAQVAELVKAGEEVSVIDNQTGEDLTASVVSRLIGQEKKPRTGKVSPRIMMQLLRKGGGTLTDYARKYTSVVQSAVTLAEDEVDKVVGVLVKDKELTRSEGSRLKAEITGYTEALKKWVGERVDRRMHEVLGAMNLASRDQVKALEEKVDALTREMARLRLALANSSADEDPSQ